MARVHETLSERTKWVLRIKRVRQATDTMDHMTALLRGLIGIAAVLGIALLFSENRRKTNWRMVGWGLLIQVVLAVLILKGEAIGDVFPPLAWPKAIFAWLSSLIVLVLRFSTEGAHFILGDIALPPEGPMEPGTPLAVGQSWGSAIAFQVLTTIIFFGTLMAVLYHLGIMPRIVRLMARGVTRLLGVSGAESLTVTSNIFLGQTEAPLVIRPYLEKLTRSELMAVMSGGMATIAGGVMAAYIVILAGPVAAMEGITIEAAQLLFAEHLLGASFMAAPAALVLAKILIPETGHPETLGTVDLAVPTTTRNTIDAAATGAIDGVRLVINISAILLAFIAMIAMVDYMLDWGAGLLGHDLSLSVMLGWLFAPIAWLIGVPAQDVTHFGSLLGIKVVANEFVAYLQMGELMSAEELSPKTVVMAAFALCGFANFSSIAIQIGGIAPLAPGYKALVAELGLKAVLAGTLANLMTATIAGILAA